MNNSQYKPCSKPVKKPDRPFFSSGPTVKPKGWTTEFLNSDLIGRSHRSALGKEKLGLIIELTKTLLDIPDNYWVGIIPGSTTGAMNCTFWNFLGALPVDIFSWDLFGDYWIHELKDQLHLKNLNIYQTPYGQIPDLSVYDSKRDTVFVWNGTTTGVCVPNADWITSDRDGLTICDATSAAFAMPLDWQKLDVTAFSWQKALGSEAGWGMLVLSPNAQKRLEEYIPSWPLPRLLRLKTDQKIQHGFFNGETINTVSLLAVEDCLHSLKWAEKMGGLSALIEKTNENFETLAQWAQQTQYFDLAIKNDAFCSKTSVCLSVSTPHNPNYDPWKFIQRICTLLAQENVAYDIKGHGLSTPCIRIWCGPTVEKQDLVDLTPWLEWAYEQVLREI